MMIVLLGPDGMRQVPEGEPYRLLPGEQVIGSAADELEAKLEAELATHQVGLGDFVERAIAALPDAVRPKHCTQCEKRKQIMNRVREIGVVEMVKQVLKV
jgi:hypothetical protein